MTTHATIFEALCRPFHKDQVKTRPGQGGRSLSYITAPTAANRLDEVLGPENWNFEIRPWGSDNLIGSLTIRLPDGTTIKRENVGGRADMAASDDDAKSAASDCFKRCCALLGVGRYLYGDGSAFGGNEEPPAPSNGHSTERRPSQQDGPRREYGLPRHGRQFFPWLKDQEKRHQVALLKYVDGWAKAQGFPYKMIEWDEAQTEVAVAEVQRKLQAPAGREPGSDDDRETFLV